MNVFFTCVTDDLSDEVLNKLIERYNPEGCYIVHAASDSYKKTKGNLRECYFHAKLAKGDYSGYAFEKDCPPLDEKLLKSMSEHESIVLKMIERFSDARVPMDYESRVRHYHRHLRYWNHMLDAANIRIAIFYTVTHEVYDYIIYRLCQKKGIPVAFSYFGVSFEYSYFAREIADPCPEILARYKMLALQYQNAAIEEIELPAGFQKIFDAFSGDRHSKKSPSYMIKRVLPFPQKIESLLKMPKALLKQFVRYKGKFSKKGLSYIFSSAQFYLGGAMKKKYHLKSLARIYDKMSVPADYSKPYIYFPLQFQPECTSSPMSGLFVHQLLIAQMLSFYLPENIQIYVKEHPHQVNVKDYPHMAMRGSRNAQLYYDLAALPNVKLVSRYTDTYQLIENCVAVASGTGTAGFEGMFMGKPFLMFGNNVNMYAPGTFNIRSNEDCEKAIKYVVQKGAKHTIRDMKLYMKALSEVEIRCSIDPSYCPVDISDEENADRVANGFAKVIDEQLASQHL